MEDNVLYIARTPDPVYWSAGWHKDSELHAIATARKNFGSSGDVYMVYQASEGSYVDGMGSFCWPKGKEAPKLLCCYDAAGNYLGETLKEVADDVAKDMLFDHCLDDKTLDALKRYAKEHK